MAVVTGPHSQGWRRSDLKPLANNGRCLLTCLPRCFRHLEIMEAVADDHRDFFRHTQTGSCLHLGLQGTPSCTEHLLEAISAMLQVRVAPIAVNDVGGSGMDSSFVQSFLHDVSCCIMSSRGLGVLQLHGSCAMIEQESFCFSIMPASPPYVACMRLVQMS